MRLSEEEKNEKIESECEVRTRAYVYDNHSSYKEVKRDQRVRKMKKKLLWVIQKQFDIVTNSATRLEIIKYLQRRYDVRLLTGFRNRKIQPDSGGNEIIYYDSVKIPVLNRLSAYLYQLRVFSSSISSFRPDVVLFNCNNPILLRHAAAIRKKHGLKLVLDVRTLPVATGRVSRCIDKKLFGLSLRFASRHFDGITYITDEMRRFCISTYNLPLHPSTIWSSGVSEELFYPKHGNSDNGPFKILYHGTIAKKRRLDNAIKALTLLKDIEVRLEFLGDGDALAGLKDLAGELGVIKRVSFINTVKFNAVPQWINHGHAGILPFPDWPGWNTSSPIKLFEYLSCGKPVIVTDIPAHRSVLDGCNFAFWAEESSPKALANAIRRANEHRNRFVELGRKARDFVRKNYTWEHQANKLKEFLEDVLNKKCNLS